MIIDKCPIEEFQPIFETLAEELMTTVPSEDISADGNWRNYKLSKYVEISEYGEPFDWSSLTQRELEECVTPFFDEIIHLYEHSKKTIKLGRLSFSTFSGNHSPIGAFPLIQSVMTVNVLFLDPKHTL